jgi:transcriptional regulator of arginine metabolism
VRRLDRQNALLRIVRAHELSTQAEVAAALRDEGFAVVQTTVSRDLADLGLVKVRAPSGRLVYALPGTGDDDRLQELGTALRRYLVSAEAAGSTVVLVTPAGFASALSQAIDEAGHPAIAGTIAGDNTIFVAVRDGTTAAALRAELVGHLLEGAA